MKTLEQFLDENPHLDFSDCNEDLHFFRDCYPRLDDEFFERAVNAAAVDVNEEIEDLKRYHTVYDREKFHELCKQAEKELERAEIARAEMLEAFQCLIQNLLKQHGLSFKRRRGILGIDSSDYLYADFGTVRVKCHAQAKGGGFNAGNGERFGESEVSIVLHESGEVEVERFEPSIDDELTEDEQRELEKRIGAFFESIPERFERGEK
jgi:hypothetical protein